jgi:hypothetical protein
MLVAGDLSQRLDQLRDAAGQYCCAHRAVRTPAGKGVGQTRRRQFRCVRLDPVGEPPSGVT